MVTSANPMTDRPRFALRFISGKYQGGEFPLRMNREIIIGRSSDLDMVLVEDMVSRRHAKITVTGDQIFIQDLGSTNGTFVNGEKVKRARLNEGDRIGYGVPHQKVAPLPSCCPRFVRGQRPIGPRQQRVADAGGGDDGTDHR